MAIPSAAPRELTDVRPVGGALRDSKSNTLMGADHLELVRLLSPAAGMSEHARIQLLIERDGLPRATDWVRRTMHIYRRAVLTKGHFAHSYPYRLRFIVAYLEFKRWLKTGSQNASM